jgi:WD repeat-containing protein 48
MRGGKITRNDSNKPEGANNNGGSNTGNTSSTSKNTTATGNEAKQQQSQEEDTTQQTNDDTTSLSSSQNIPTPTLYHPPHHHYYPIRQMHPLIQPPFGPYPAHETPEIQIPQHTTVIISEDSHEASTSVDLYRGTVGDMDRDAETIEQKAPTWLIEFLIKVGKRNSDENLVIF